MMGEKSKWFLKTFTDFFCSFFVKKKNQILHNLPTVNLYLFLFYTDQTKCIHAPSIEISRQNYHVVLTDIHLVYFFQFFHTDLTKYIHTSNI